MLLSDLQSKDIINVNDGNNLGRIIDAKVDDNGKIIYFVSEEKKMFKRVKNGENTFDFNKIVKIGSDVILVNL